MNTDRLTIRLIVSFMGIIAVGIVYGGIWLADHNSSLPDALIALGGVALGNLGTFLVSSRTGTDAQDVTVVNEAADPVPVDPTGGRRPASATGGIARS